MPKNLDLPFSDTEASVRARMEAVFGLWVNKRRQSPSRLRDQRALLDTSKEIYDDMWHALTAYCADSLGKAIDDFTPADLEGFFAEREKKAKKKLTPRYLRRFLSLVDRVADTIAEAEQREKNTAAHTLLQGKDLYRKANYDNESGMPVYLNPNDTDRLIRHVSELQSVDLNQKVSWREIRNRTAVALMLGAGLAPGDVRNLRLGGILRFSTHDGGSIDKLSLPGNGNAPGRETPLAQWAVDQLEFWLAVRHRQGLPGDYVFPSTKEGSQWSHEQCFRACTQVLEDAGLNKQGGLFKLRHSFAVRQLADGFSETEVVGWLGLADPAGIARYRNIIKKPVRAA